MGRTEKLSPNRSQGVAKVSGSVLPDDVLRDAPSYTPRPHELADLELLLSGAYAPLTGFLGRTDLSSLQRRGRLGVAPTGKPGDPGRAGRRPRPRRWPAPHGDPQRPGARPGGQGQDHRP